MAAALLKMVKTPDEEVESDCGCIAPKNARMMGVLLQVEQRHSCEILRRTEHGQRRMCVKPRKI